MTNTPTGSSQHSSLQLHDIHLPEEVSTLPIAPGWWILLALIVCGALWSYKRYQKNKQLNASKDKALTILANNKTLSAKECIALLKWAAMQYFSRQQLAKLYGERFQEFLIVQLPEKHRQSFTELSNAAFADQYKAEESKAEPLTTTNIEGDCHQATTLWLTYALPIKKVKS